MQQRHSRPRPPLRHPPPWLARFDGVCHGLKVGSPGLRLMRFPKDWRHRWPSHKRPLMFNQRPPHRRLAGLPLLRQHSPRYRRLAQMPLVKQASVVQGLHVEACPGSKVGTCGHLRAQWFQARSKPKPPRHNPPRLRHPKSLRPRPPHLERLPNRWSLHPRLLNNQPQPPLPNRHRLSLRQPSLHRPSLHRLQQPPQQRPQRPPQQRSRLQQNRPNPLPLPVAPRHQVRPNATAPSP